jgi:tetratricopeptide (TPR) repeat protein
LNLRRTLRNVIVGAVVAASSSGCIAPNTERLVAARGSLPARSEAASVPFFAQERYYCGPASLAMALAWSGLSVTADDLVTQVYTPGRQGTFAADILAAARRNGRIAIELHTLDALLGELAADHPVIVFQNLSLSILPRWHFAVAIGYDLDARHIILRSGTEERLLLELDVFERTWERADNWALVVLAPGMAPASKDALPWLAAASALERVERPADAVTAYRVILAAHPGDRRAGMGEANALFALNDFRGAEQGYRAVIASNPEMAEAWNNLAYALHRQGRLAEALASARRAVAIGGEGGVAYAETLRELSGQ